MLWYVSIGILDIHFNKNRLVLSGFKWDSEGLESRAMSSPVRSLSLSPNVCASLYLAPPPPDSTSVLLYAVEVLFRRCKAPD